MLEVEGDGAAKVRGEKRHRHLSLNIFFGNVNRLHPSCSKKRVLSLLKNLVWWKRFSSATLQTITRLLWEKLTQVVLTVPTTDKT